MHWIDRWSLPPKLDWKAASDLALSFLFPSIVWLQLLKLIQNRSEIAAQFGFEIVLKRLPDKGDRILSEQDLEQVVFIPPCPQSP